MSLGRNSRRMRVSGEWRRSVCGPPPPPHTHTHSTGHDDATAAERPLYETWSQWTLTSYISHSETSNHFFSGHGNIPRDLNIHAVNTVRITHDVTGLTGPAGTTPQSYRSGTCMPNWNRCVERFDIANFYNNAAKLFTHLSAVRGLSAPFLVCKHRCQTILNRTVWNADAY
jgi:hypothetical protein